MELLPVILVVFETSRVFKVWVEIHGFGWEGLLHFPQPQ